MGDGVAKATQFGSLKSESDRQPKWTISTTWTILMPQILKWMIVNLLCNFADIVALDDTFLRIPGLKRSRSPETAEDNDDSFSFLNTEGNEHSPSPQQESPSTILNIQSSHISGDQAGE